MKTILIAILVVNAMNQQGDISLTIEGAQRHPTVYMVQEDVNRAREKLETGDLETVKWFKQLERNCSRWDHVDEEWIRSMMPGPGACFAYGFTGCPECGGTWKWWAKAECSFDNPGYITCSGGHTLPNEKYPDPGTGYVAEDGRTHYFVGSYNSWAVEHIAFSMGAPLAEKYLITGDERAGRLAVVILDELARIFPTCDKGSWDYPSQQPSGRLNRPWYQVARILVKYVRMYELVYHNPLMEEASSVAGLTKRENIEKNLLMNAAQYCYEQSKIQGGLHNGQADYVRGVLAVGVCLGIPEYVEWAVDGPYGINALLSNNVDRDGRYFETSLGYSFHTRHLYLTFAEPLYYYRSKKYPEGLNIYDNPRFQSFLFLPQMSFNCLGLKAPFGDSAPIRTRNRYPYRSGSILDCAYTEYLATRVSDPVLQESYSALLYELRSRDTRDGYVAPYQAEWRIFHADDNLARQGPLPVNIKDYLDGSIFFGQKGFSTMRKGTGETQQAAVIRFGPSLVHGHYDDLNVNYFAQGYEMTYDLGYHLGSTHTQVGWAKRTISHNMVVVDEVDHGHGTLGGSLLHFHDSPGLVLTEATSTAYEHLGVDIYRRLFALTDSYALNVCRVKGGKQHDLPLHSLSTEVECDGLQFGPVQKGSLASADIEWGNLQLNDGDMKGHPEKPYWNPPPGNGYGFLVSPSHATPEQGWSASWKLDSGSDTRFIAMSPDSNQESVISATAPGLYPTYPKARHIIRRRRQDVGELSSCFVSLWQGSTNEFPAPVESINRIDNGGELSASSGVILKVQLIDGSVDIWCLNPSPDTKVEGELDGKAISFKGSIAWCRFDGEELMDLTCLEWDELQIGDWVVKSDSPNRKTVLAKISDNHTQIELKSEWPDDGRYKGSPVYFDNQNYLLKSAYTIKKLEGQNLFTEQTGTLLGKAIVSEIKDASTLVTMVPHEYSRLLGSKTPSYYFKGKNLSTQDGKSRATVDNTVFNRGKCFIHVDSTEPFQKGQTLLYHDLQSGDSAAVQHFIEITKTSSGYSINTNTNSTVKGPGEKSRNVKP